MPRKTAKPVKVRSELARLLRDAPKLATKLGLHEGSKILGAGGEGVVFETLRGTAVKLTSNSTDASISTELVGKRLKHVVRVISVHKVPGSIYWAIQMERLERNAPSKAHWKIRVEHARAGMRALLLATGFFHDDMHPKNLMFCPRTKVYKLIDFGWGYSGPRRTAKVGEDLCAGDV